MHSTAHTRFILPTLKISVHVVNQIELNEFPIIGNPSSSQNNNKRDEEITRKIAKQKICTEGVLVYLCHSMVNKHVAHPKRNISLTNKAALIPVSCSSIQIVYLENALCYK